jgi:hypothetical protein
MSQNRDMGHPAGAELRAMGIMSGTCFGSFRGKA